ELTTHRAVIAEFYGNRKNAPEVNSSPQRAGYPPLVLARFDEKPLKDAFEELSDLYDVSVVLDARVKDKGKTAVTGKFLNVPFDTAVTLLADQVDLEAVRLDNVWYVTTKENARALQQAHPPRKLEKPNQSTK